MTVEPISPVTPEEVVPASEAPTSYAKWARQTMQRLLEDEKKWIELAAEQNELTLKAIRQGVEFYRTIPPLPLGGLARQEIQRIMGYRKPEQEPVSMEVPEVESEEIPPAFKTQSGVMRQQFETLVEFRRRWLDFMVQQNTQFLDGVQEALGLKEYRSATNLNNWAQKMMENYVEMQKRLLGLANQTPAESEVQEVVPEEVKI